MQYIVPLLFMLDVKPPGEFLLDTAIEDRCYISKRKSEFTNKRIRICHVTGTGNDFIILMACQLWTSSRLLTHAILLSSGVY